MEQVVLNFDASPFDGYAKCREFIAHRIHKQGVPQKAIAADMDYSPSHLNRKVTQSPKDTAKFTLDDAELFIEVTGDISPVYYLVHKYAANRPDRIAELEAELARLKKPKK
jgi:hypothetical protein